MTCPVSQAELSWCMAPPFTFPHYLCINTAGLPIPRGSKTADTLLRLEKFTDVHFCSCRVGPCQPMEGWFHFHADIPLSCLWLVLWTARPCYSTWIIEWGVCKICPGPGEIWGPGGSLCRDNSPSVAERGCLWPSWFWGEKLPGYLPMAVPTPVLELHFGIYPGFWQEWLKPSM